jgi:hypothetical protein
MDGLRVLVPLVDPPADVGLELGDAAIDRSAEIAEWPSPRRRSARVTKMTASWVTCPAVSLERSRPSCLVDRVCRPLLT